MLGGSGTSCKAPVGQDPMHDKQPTHAASTTITGRLGWFRPSGFSARGSKASNGQKGMQRSHPVQAESVMPTMAWPMAGGQRPTF